jgi:D-glycero-D-manno-heptose 1,7-bisphosphate phosphatase
MQKALFLDRDGVINKEVGYLYRIEDFQFIDGVIDTCLFFQRAGYLLVVITNQAGIARGYYTEDDFHTLNCWMVSQFQKCGVEISKTYYSPYHPDYGKGRYRKDSFCRKPKPGMILQAKQEFNIDLTKSIIVGDKQSDIEAGVRAGIKHCILVRSGHPISLTQHCYANFILESLADLPSMYSLES